VATPFVRGATERPLRIVFDHGSIAQDATTEALAGFAHHDLIDAVEIDGSGGIPALAFGDVNVAADMMDVVKHASGKSHFVAFGQAQLPDFARDFVVEGLGTDPALMERELRVAGVAAAWGADALVTDSDFLLTVAPRPMVADANPVRPEQAIALCGLYLRSRDDFTIAMDSTYSWALSRQAFDWALARALLPAGWRFFGHCLAADPNLDGPVPYLAQAVFERVAQALRARERVVLHSRRGGGFGPADEQLFYFDHAVLALGGAFDAVARVADATYGLANKPQGISWRYESWLPRIALVAPGLAALMENGGRARDVLDAISILRNTIHGEPLQGIRFSEGSVVRRQEHLVKIPRGKATALLGVLDRLDGRERWGVRTVCTDFLFFRADEFIDVLMTEACRALDQLMAATDVSRLPNGTQIAIQDGPSASGGDEFAPEAQRAIRALAGL
jgi:hypothetical protein